MVTGAPRSVVDMLPHRMAQTMRRAGIRTNADAQALTCAQLLGRPRIGRLIVRALVEQLAAAELRLACRCGWDGRRARFCALARRHKLQPAPR